MNILHELDCRAARAALSARLDGELADDRDLVPHLDRCASCRDFEGSLAGLSAGWAALRVAEPPATLRGRIEARAVARATRPRPTLALRVAAGLVGFAGVGGAMWWLDREVTASTAPAQWVESLTPITHAPETSALFASLPEYQLLVGFPRVEDER